VQKLKNELEQHWMLQLY